MSERTARIRINLNSSGLLSGLGQIGDSVTRLGSRMKEAFGAPAREGLAAMKTSIVETASKAKELVGMAVGIAGGLSVGAGAQGAIALEDRYRELAFTVAQATGEATKWRDVQRTIEPVADAVGRTSKEMIAGYDAIIGKTINAQFSAKALGLVGEAMNATGRSAEELGTLVGTLNKKWGITDMGEVRQALMQLFEASKNIKFDELAEDLDEVGSIAKSGGMTGIDGFRRSLGLAAAIAPSTNRTFSEVLAGMDQLTEKMRQMPVWEGLAKAGKFAGKDFFDKFTAQPDAMNRVRMMLESAGKKGTLKQFAREAIEVEFTGREERAAYKVLADPFMAAFEEAQKAGKDTKSATEAGLAAFDAAIGKLGATTMDWAQIQDRAADNQQSTTAKIRQAQELWQRAFTDEKTLVAMAELATSLPKIAEGMASLVKFAVDSPWIAGGTLIGGKAALAGAGSLAGSAGSAIWGGIAEKFTDVVNRKKAPLSVDVFDSMGMKTGTKTVEVAGSKLGNVAKIAGQALGVAAAAVLAYEIGKMAIDKFMGDDLRRRNEGENAAAIGEAVLGTGDKKQQAVALEQARAKLKELEKGPGTLESIMGGIATVATGGEVKSAGEMNDEARAKLTRTITDLEEALSGGSEKGRDVSRSFGEMTVAARNATRELRKLAPPAGSNGPPGSPSNAPGHSGASGGY